jgi:hypothetical protein
MPETECQWNAPYIIWNDAIGGVYVQSQKQPDFRNFYHTNRREQGLKFGARPFALPPAFGVQCLEFCGGSALFESRV